jgi:hypothetical protein
MRIERLAGETPALPERDTQLPRSTKSLNCVQKQMPAQDKWLAGLALTCLAASGFSAAAAPDWENEQIVPINTEPPRATFVPFADVAGALAGNPEASPFFYLYPKYWEVKKV